MRMKAVESDRIQGIFGIPQHDLLVACFGNDR